jgi:hypothetical protein
VLDKSLLSSQIFITQFKRTPFLYNIWPHKLLCSAIPTYLAYSVQFLQE